MTLPSTAMLLAAGAGERMQPLSGRVPKPLLRAGGHALIEHHLHALASAGIEQAVINVAARGSLLRAALGDGRHYGLGIRYSDEGRRALETAGGIARALPWLGERFVVVSTDIWTDLDFRDLAAAPDSDAHLLLVANPPHHPRGDFALRGDRVLAHGAPRLTYAGIGIYRARLFEGLPDGPARLGPLLRRAAADGRVSGQSHRGAWMDVGTPARLAALRALLGEEDVDAGGGNG